MSEQEKFDELIREKFAEKEFIFNEENWEKAEKIIDASKTTTKLLRRSIIFLIGLITGICAMFPLIKRSTTTNKSAYVNKQVMIEPAITRKFKGSANKQNSTEYAATKKQSTTTIPLENGLAADKKKAEWESNKFNANIPSTEMAPVVLTSQHEPETNKQTLAVSKKARIQVQTTHLGSAPKVKSSANHRNNAIRKKTIGAVVETNEDDVTSAYLQKSHDERASTTFISHVTGGTSNAKKNKSSKKIPATKMSAPAETILADSSVTSGIAETEMDEKTNTNETALLTETDSTKTPVPEQTEKDSINVKADSLSPTIPNKPSEPSATSGLAKITILSVDAGMNGQLGWKTNNMSEGRGITPVIGIGITHYFNQTWSICMGVHYENIYHLKAGQTKTNTTYSFGSITTSDVIETTILHYAVLPFLLQYQLNDKNSLLCGGSIGYLLNTKSTKSSYKTSVGPVPTAEESELRKKISGTSSEIGFNHWDAGLSIGYRRQLTSHISLTALASFGLLDIRKNTLFLQDKIERNTGLKLILSYNIFDF